MKNCKTIIFSRNRALQANLLLTTLFQHCADIEQESDIFVLHRNDESHEQSYEILQSEFPTVNFVKETNFKQDLLEILDSHESNISLGTTPPYMVVFITDDTIFTEDFSMKEVISALVENKDTMGFSLRLGENTTECFSLGRKQEIPTFFNIKENINKFNWITSDADFSYALELSSSVYALNKIIDILTNCSYYHPNSLEDVLYANLFNYVLFFPNLLCYKKSVCFSSPLNKVQTSNLNNRSGNSIEFTTESLLKLYLGGIRINSEKFDNYPNKGCHEIVNLL